LGCVKKNFIHDTYCSKTFDHKPIQLHVGKYMRKGRKTVNNRVICHPLLLFIATISVYESYLKHISVARNSVADILLSRLCIQLAQVDLEISNLLQYCDAWA